MRTSCPIWKETATGHAQHRFYLGRDKAEAQRRSEQLERLWELVGQRWQRDKRTDRPLWDSVSLLIGQAIAKGEAVVTYESTKITPEAIARSAEQKLPGYKFAAGAAQS